MKDGVLLLLKASQIVIARKLRMGILVLLKWTYLLHTSGPYL
jgi:hypothetical protein